MKTITKKLAALGVVGLGLALSGCQQSNESGVMVDAQGKKQGEGVTPPNAPKSSADFMKQNKSGMQDPANQKSYKAQQQ